MMEACMQRIANCANAKSTAILSCVLACAGCTLPRSAPMAHRGSSGGNVPAAQVAATVPQGFSLLGARRPVSAGHPGPPTGDHHAAILQASGRGLAVSRDGGLPLGDLGSLSRASCYS
jgi:hypothetical protein